MSQWHTTLPNNLQSTPRIIALTKHACQQIQHYTINDFKVPITWKIIAAYLKGFSKYRRKAFIFYILEILMFLYYVLLASEMYITKETNDTHSVVAMETLCSSLFLSKSKYPHFQPFKAGTRILEQTQLIPYCPNSYH